jgi:hypothetical protein
MKSQQPRGRVRRWKLGHWESTWLILRLHQESMDTELDFAGLVGKGRIEPLGFLANIFGGRVR